MFPTDDDFSRSTALVEAAVVPGAELFVFPASGQIEAILVLAPDRFVFELRTDNAMCWFDQLGLERGAAAVDLEAAISCWCEWVPRFLRGCVLGTETVEDFEAPRH